MDTSNPPSQLRRARIETLKAEANSLMGRANQEPIREQVRLALRDLDEALIWLREKNIDTRPHILKIVDLVIELASIRVVGVAKALHTYGPDATIINIG